MRSSRKRKRGTNIQTSTDVQDTGRGVKFQCLNGSLHDDISPSSRSSVFTNVMGELCDDSNKVESFANIKVDASKENSSGRSLHCVKVWTNCCRGSTQPDTTPDSLPPTVESEVLSGCTESIAMAEQSVYPAVKTEPVDPSYENDNASLQTVQSELTLGCVKSEADHPPVEPHLVSLTTEGGAPAQIKNTREINLPVEPQLHVQPRSCSQSAEIPNHVPIEPIADTEDVNLIEAPLALNLKTEYNGLSDGPQPSDNTDSADVTDETDETDLMSSEVVDEAPRQQLKVVKVAKFRLGNIRKARGASAGEGCCVDCDSNKQMLTRICSLMHVIHDQQDQILRRFDKLEQNVAQLKRTVAKTSSPLPMQESTPSSSPKPTIPQVLPCTVGVGISKSVMKLGAHRDECDFTEDRCIIPDSVLAMVEEKSDGNIQVFASTLTMALYRVEELQGRAVDGSKHGKAPLSPRRLGAIKEKAFEVHSVPHSLQRDKWLRCKNAINSKLRHLFKKC